MATTLLDPAADPLEEIAALYGDRSTVELRLRDIKTTMQMDVLRGKLPHRRGRVEPGAVKRRPRQYARLNKPRDELRQALPRKTG